MRPVVETVRERSEMQTITTLALIAAGNKDTHTILWVIAAVLVIAGIVSIFRGGVLWGVLLIIAGLLVGPGGVSVFS